jgi:DNA helicase-2/ATP-dependent DNA helicase PcrA
VLAYLRLLVNPRDDLSFLRAVNEPTRGIGKVTLDHLREHAAPREMGLLAAAAEVQRIAAIKGRAAASLREFAEMMQDLAKLADAAPDEVIRQVLDRSGYRRMLLDSTDTEDQERLANIEELISAARQFAQEDQCRTIGDFLENITLASDVDGWDERQDRVSVMTLHAAKGLEFPVVYMVALEQGLLPHERSIGREEEVEEERRLAFVGMTRAKEELYLCHALQRDFRGDSRYTVPSMFLKELPEDVRGLDFSDGAAGAHHSFDYWRDGGGPAARQGWTDAGLPPKPAPVPPRKRSGGNGKDFAVGMVVRHPKYGTGQVVELTTIAGQRYVRIRFATAGTILCGINQTPLEIVAQE